MFAGDVVEAICSGVWGIDIEDQGSFRLMDDVEKRSLGRNTRVQDTKWCRRIDMDDDALARSYCSHSVAYTVAYFGPSTSSPSSTIRCS